MINVDEFKEIFPDITDNVINKYLHLLNDSMPKYGILSGKQQANFIAHVGHESSRFSRVIENMNYSAARLREVFPKYFRTIEQANKYARKPEMIGNYVYANRMGNGDETSGDGYRFRGRGLLQITGRYNYTVCGKALNIDLINNPDLLCQPIYAVESACWWFEAGGINKIIG